MNSLGLNLIFKMGCICSRDSIYINSTKYYILERLGEGGFSTVDLVENSSTRQKYALKKITCHSVEDQKIALKEVEYCKQIKHQNVIELIDSTFKGTADIVINTTSELYMVLPYYKLGTLHDYLEKRSFQNEHLDATKVLRLFLEICEGVKAFHDATPEPLAHRDLKTANICLTDSFQPVIMDLGSAAPARVQICGPQEAQRLQDLAAERCSMPYRAPELFNVESYCVIDERTDIWSLGCLLYAMCYFKSPFDSVYERGDSVALAVLSGNVKFPEEAPFTQYAARSGLVFPRQINPRVPDIHFTFQDMHNLISYMLKVNSMERPYIYSVIEKIQDYITLLESSA